MQLNPYLNFPGTCREAFQLYEKVLGGKIVGMMSFGDVPDPSHQTPELRDLVMHARLEADGFVLMGSDAPGERYEKPQGLWLSLHPATAEEGKRIFDALADGGHTVMPFAETFWAAGYGMTIDRFGTPWMVNVEKRRSA